METANPLVVFLAPYAAAGATAFCLLIHKGEGVSLKAVGTSGYYALIGGALAPIMAGWNVPGLTAISKLERLLAYSVTIGGGIIGMPLLKSLTANALKNWTAKDES